MQYKAVTRWLVSLVKKLEPTPSEECDNISSTPWCMYASVLTDISELTDTTMMEVKGQKPALGRQWSFQNTIGVFTPGVSVEVHLFLVDWFYVT